MDRKSDPLALSAGGVVQPLAASACLYPAVVMTACSSSNHDRCHYQGYTVSVSAEPFSQPQHMRVTHVHTYTHTHTHLGMHRSVQAEYITVHFCGF